MTNIILNTDSYKTSQFVQYPPNTTGIFSYIESRGGDWTHTVFYGLQGFLKEYLCKPVTQDMIEEAREVLVAHGEPFNEEGWKYILGEYGGFLPLIIRAVPEGSVVPVRNVLATVENTDLKCGWLTSYIETPLLRGVWYPTTVATNSYESKKMIFESLVKTGDPEGISFKLHDFGARGVSSFESAGIGGSAHLVNFMGTDTISGLLYARKYYNTKAIPGYSIVAMEHSTVTSWGRENESKAYSNMLDKFAKPGALIACVSDSYDIYNACSKIWGEELRQKVIDSGAVVVIRPDSGDPATVVVKCLRLLAEKFGYTTNTKGYKVLNHVRVIQGDGIDHASIRSIIFNVETAGFSLDNVAFGQGGGLLQQIDRDTMKFAMKCSAARIDEKWVPVFKDPITDSGKQSKKGRVTLYQDRDGSYRSGVEDWEKSALETVYLNGKMVKEYTFEEIRERANAPFITQSGKQEAA